MGKRGRRPRRPETPPRARTGPGVGAPASGPASASASASTTMTTTTTATSAATTTTTTRTRRSRTARPGHRRAKSETPSWSGGLKEGASVRPDDPSFLGDPAEWTATVPPAAAAAAAAAPPRIRRSRTAAASSAAPRRGGSRSASATPRPASASRGRAPAETPSWSGGLREGMSVGPDDAFFLRGDPMRGGLGIDRLPDIAPRRLLLQYGVEGEDPLDDGGAGVVGTLGIRPMSDALGGRTPERRSGRSGGTTGKGPTGKGRLSVERLAGDACLASMSDGWGGGEGASPPVVAPSGSRGRRDRPAPPRSPPPKAGAPPSPRRLFRDDGGGGGPARIGAAAAAARMTGAAAGDAAPSPPDRALGDGGGGRRGKDGRDIGVVVGPGGAGRPGQSVAKGADPPRSSKRERDDGGVRGRGTRRLRRSVDPADSLVRSRPRRKRSHKRRRSLDSPGEGAGSLLLTSCFRSLLLTAAEARSEHK